jgi:Phenylalanyl-tRNA synthetase beta subunit
VRGVLGSWRVSLGELDLVQNSTTKKRIKLNLHISIPKSIRKTSKKLNIDTDAKFRFERGIDPSSIEEGLIKAANLIKDICGGKINKIDVQKISNQPEKKIKFEIGLLEKISGIKISNKEILKILKNLGFETKLEKNFFKLKVPSWRPDIEQSVDVVEELVRIYGYDKIKKIDPVKIRVKPTLNKVQKLFHFLQRSVASKGYKEAITWSFTDSKINDFFKSKFKNLEIINPISSDLNVLRNSIFSNLIIYLNKNLDRGIKDFSLFEIGPVFFGSNPGDQETVVGGLRSGKVSRSSWIEKERNIDIFDIKKECYTNFGEVG